MHTTNIKRGAAVNLESKCSKLSLKTAEIIAFIDSDGCESLLKIHRECGIACAVKKHVVERMWLRYNKQKNVNDGNGICSCQESRQLFREQLERLAQRQVLTGIQASLCYSGKGRLYHLWRESSFIGTELVADELTEIVVCENYCGTSCDDELLGGLQRWDVGSDMNYYSAGVTPPLCNHVIIQLVDTFEKNVLHERAYCRVAVLPSEKTFEVEIQVQNDICGCLLLEMDLTRTRQSSDLWI